VVYTKGHHCHFSLHLRDGQLLMLQVQAIVMKGKAFEGFACLLIQCPPLQWSERFSSSPLAQKILKIHLFPSTKPTCHPHRGPTLMHCASCPPPATLPCPRPPQQGAAPLKFDGLNSQPAACTNTYIHTKYPQSSPMDTKAFTDLVAHQHQAKVLLFHLSHKNSLPLSPSTLIRGFRKSGVNAIGSIFMQLEYLCEP